MAYYPQFILASQLLWILAFMLMPGMHAGPLVQARLDGKYG
jgi:hypothetical protein